MHTIEFVKLSGSGNDFICVDNRDGRLDPLVNTPDRARALARTVCARATGVGADGLIFAGDDDVGKFADVSARFFEPDGSEAELCGNGTACFARWAIESGWAGEEVRVLTVAGVVRGRRVDAPYVRVCIPLPERPRYDFELQSGAGAWRCDFAVTGVPHLVTYVPNVADVDMEASGRPLRHHPQMGPRGVNVNFVQVLAPGELAVRTFEFGVEAETLSCGTGAATAAVMSLRRFGWGGDFATGARPVIVHSRGGADLRVFVTLDAQGNVADLCLDTSVEFVFRGTIHPDLLRRAGVE
jgi:diaminopimelate epimerase